MISLNEFIYNIGFNEKAANFLLNYNITDSEYLYCKELFFSNTDSLLKYSEQKTDSKAFLLKLFVMLAIDNFDSIINELSLKRTALANADLTQIYFDTMSDIRIWQEVYQRNTGQIGLIEPLWVSNAVKGRLYRFGRLQFEPDNNTNIVHIHISEGESLDSEKCKAAIKTAEEFFSEYTVFDCLSWLLSPNILPLLDYNSNIRHFQALFDIKYISYNFPQAEQRVIGEYAYNKKSRLILKLENYLRRQGDPGMGYGVIKNRAVAK